MFWADCINDCFSTPIDSNAFEYTYTLWIFVFCLIFNESPETNNFGK